MQPTVIVRGRAEDIKPRALTRFVEKACRLVGLGGTVTVLVTSDREMRSLNLRFRGKNAPTDVLSFLPWVHSDGFAGDIAISREMAVRNARALKHSLLDEVRILVLHGILHLAGYDHERDDGQMAAKESELRRQLMLPESLIQRAVDGNRKDSRARQAKRLESPLKTPAQSDNRRSSTSLTRVRT